MLDRRSWENFTNDLPAGRSVRVEHDCGEGRVLKVSHNDQGYSAWCFRCGDSGFIPHPQPSLSERLARLRAVRSVELEVTQTVSLPLPAVPNPQEWPVAARLWLYKAGFSNDDIERLGFYWCPRIERVVLPVHDGGVLRYWQARSIDPNRQPKYINPLVDKSNLAAKYGEGPCIVLTEDMLSASRVARVTEAWSLLGTALPDGVASQLAERRAPVVIMLDPDAGGFKATPKIFKRLQAVGLPVSVAVPSRDPKYLTPQEIASCIANSKPPPRFSLPQP